MSCKHLGEISENGASPQAVLIGIGRLERLAPFFGNPHFQNWPRYRLVAVVAETGVCAAGLLREPELRTGKIEKHAKAKTYDDEHKYNHKVDCMLTELLRHAYLGCC